MARVAMLVSNHHDLDPRVQKEAVALVSAGHTVRVYAYDRMHESRCTDEVVQGVHIQRLQLKKRAYGDAAAALIGLHEYRVAVGELLRADLPDVLHCHDQDTCAVGLRFKLQHRTRFVFDAHDLYWTFLSMGGKDATWRRAAAQTLKASHRMYAHLADLLITVTDSVGPHPGTADVYRAWGLEPLVIWNAPDVPSQVQPLPARFTVGYYGYVREPAMFDWLLSAIAELPESERPALRIAGGGTEQARLATRLQRAQHELGIPIEVSGAFRMEQMGELMAQCSVQYCLYPRGQGNVARALPVKLLDAVAHGRPVIGNADMLMADWIEARGWGWTVTDGDVSGLTRALGQARQYSTEAPQPLTAPPTWQQQADKLQAAYARLLR